MGGILLAMAALETELVGRCLIVRFTRPEIRNPLSVSVLSELHAIIDGCRDRDDIDRVIFTGSGDVFASGADLREITELANERAADFAISGQSLMAKIAALPQITVAAVNGFCFGGALDLALACDRRIASPNASFAHPGSGLGIITGWGGTQRLSHLVGTANALELFFTAAPITANRALEIGLVYEIADEPVSRAMRFVAEV